MFAVIEGPSEELIAASVQGESATVHHGQTILSPQPGRDHVFEEAGVELVEKELLRQWMDSGIESLAFFQEALSYAPYHAPSKNKLLTGQWMAAQNKATVMWMLHIGVLTVLDVNAFDGLVFPSVQALSTGDFFSCIRLAQEAKAATENPQYDALIDQLTAPVRDYLDRFYDL